MKALSLLLLRAAAQQENLLDFLEIQQRLIHALQTTLPRERRNASDADFRASFERAAGHRYPGAELGGEGLGCTNEKAARGETRRDFVTAAIRAVVHPDRLPLRRSLEIGPCAHPIGLPPQLVRAQHGVDTAAGALVCDKKLSGRYHPQYIDDAQNLSSVPSGHYDLLVAAHVGEHISDVYQALRHWLRVLVPGGLAIVVLPDPCQPGFMDRVRLAMPAAHYAAEYLRAANVHDPEMALSSLRYMDLLAANGSALDANATRYAFHLKDAQRAIALQGRQFSHVHAWSPATLVDLLVAGERLLGELPFGSGRTPFRIVVADRSGHVGAHLQSEATLARRRQAGGNRDIPGPAPEGIEYRVALLNGAGDDAAHDARREWAKLSRFVGRYGRPNHVATHLCCRREQRARLAQRAEAVLAEAARLGAT